MMIIKRDPREPFITSEHDAELLRLCYEQSLNIEEYDTLMLIYQCHQEAD